MVFGWWPNLSGGFKTALLTSLLPWHSYLEGLPLLTLSLSEVSGPLHVLSGSLPVVIWPVSVVCPAGWTLCPRQLRVPRDGKLRGPRNEWHFHRVLLVKAVTRPLKGRGFRPLLSEGEVHRICDPSLICHMQEKCSQPPRGALLHTVTQRPRLKGTLPFSACRFQACPGVGVQLADAGREEASVPTGWSVSQPWTWHVSLPHTFRGRNSAHGLTRLQGRLGNVSGQEPGGKGDGFSQSTRFSVKVHGKGGQHAIVSLRSPPPLLRMHLDAFRQVPHICITSWFAWTWWTCQLPQHLQGEASPCAWTATGVHPVYLMAPALTTAEGTESGQALAGHWPTEGPGISSFA